MVDFTQALHWAGRLPDELNFGLHDVNGLLQISILYRTRKQALLEDKILALLSGSMGSLLDNIELIEALDASKATWEANSRSLSVCHQCRLIAPGLENTFLRLLAMMMSTRLQECFSHPW